MDRTLPAVRPSSQFRNPWIFITFHAVRTGSTVLYLSARTVPEDSTQRDPREQLYGDEGARPDRVLKRARPDSG